MRRAVALLVVLLAQPRGGAGQGKRDPKNAFCSYRGRTTAEDYLVCNCTSGNTGPDCSQRVCPVGVSWAAPLIGTSGPAGAHAPLAVCSDMGYCDRALGACVCRDGFEGAACERIACPTDDLLVTCSGHGRCMTLREAGTPANWDGAALVRPHATYENRWDADKITGCVCDAGFHGHNCSLRTCPTGDDPRSKGQRNSVAHLACRADAGAFELTFRGHTTKPIRHDAHYGDLEAALNALPSVGPGGARVWPGNGSATVCGAGFEEPRATPRTPPGEVITRIEFTQAFGALPAMRARSSEPPLTRDGASRDATLEMVTNFTLRCPRCNACRGAFYLVYDGEESRRIAWDANASAVRQALAGIAALGGAASDFGPIAIEVKSSDGPTGAACKAAGAANMTIALRAPYGNVYPITLLSEVYEGDDDAFGAHASRANSRPHNMSLAAPHGTKEALPCSRRGVCDEALGQCRCFKRDSLIYKYEFISSDGYDHPGVRGDCGHEKRRAQSCPSVLDETTQKNVMCNGAGRCENATMACRCEGQAFDGACTQKRCPAGPAWCDERVPRAARRASRNLRIPFPPPLSLSLSLSLAPGSTSRARPTSRTSPPSARTRARATGSRASARAARASPGARASASTARAAATTASARATAAASRSARSPRSPTTGRATRATSRTASRAARSTRARPSGTAT